MILCVVHACTVHILQFWFWSTHFQSFSTIGKRTLVSQLGATFFSHKKYSCSKGCPCGYRSSLIENTVVKYLYCLEHRSDHFYNPNKNLLAGKYQPNNLLNFWFFFEVVIWLVLANWPKWVSSLKHRSKYLQNRVLKPTLKLGRYERQSDKGQTLVQWFMRTNESIYQLVGQRLDNLIWYTSLTFWQEKKTKKKISIDVIKYIMWVFVKLFVSQPFGIVQKWVQSPEWVFPWIDKCSPKKIPALQLLYSKEVNNKYIS